MDSKDKDYENEPFMFTFHSQRVKVIENITLEQNNSSAPYRTVARGL